ncbi:MAG: class I SAM-dependent methyltransferase [Candidatus Levybacteria bacterium]|nr:class I SAM-dependent methyltransferase [Candidatus Levybacteria bacterium]
MTERETNGELLDLTPREKLWLINYPNGYDIPGSLRLAGDFVQTIPFGSKVLEVGCGPGRVLKYLARKNIEATGVDINRAAIGYAKEHRDDPTARFEVMNGTKLRFLDNSFDNIVMVGVLGGVEPEVREKLMAEALRVVMPGGTVAVAEFKYNNDPEKLKKYEDAEKNTHERGTRIIKRGDKELIVKHFTEDELIELFTKAGFTSVQTRGESIESPGIADPKPEVRRQYTVWGTKRLSQ